ncbi:MAG: response regulator [Planctomycetes bacterium]|nr:response regulator [Planctomycetota bacterium]
MSPTFQSGDVTRRRVVLLVDDDQNHARTISRILSRDGFRVAVAKTASDARALLGVERVDAILCELALPDCSAEIFLDFVLGHCPTTRVVFTCSQFDGRRRQRLIERGATECTSLPLDLDRLKALLLGHLPHERIVGD